MPLPNLYKCRQVACSVVVVCIYSFFILHCFCLFIIKSWFLTVGQMTGIPAMTGVHLFFISSFDISGKITLGRFLVDGLV